MSSSSGPQFPRVDAWFRYRENSATGLIALVTTFGTLVILRALLESSTYLGRLMSFQVVLVEASGFFGSLFLLTVIILHRATGTRIEEITRMAVPFSAIFLTPPIVDALISSGQPLRMDYVAAEGPTELAWAYVSWLFPPYLEHGVTPGIRLELVCVMTGIAFYVWNRTGSWLRAFLAMEGFHFSAFFLGAMPFWRTWLDRVLTPESADSTWPLIERGVIYAGLTSVTCIAWYWCYDSKRAQALIRNIRLGRVAHFLACLAGGWLLSIQGVTWRPDERAGMVDDLLCAAFALVAASIVASNDNDLADIEIDQVSNVHRPIVSGVIKPSELFGINLAAWWIVAIAGVATRIDLVVFPLVAVGLYRVYSCPPVRLKRWPVASSALIATVSWVCVMWGFAIVDTSLSRVPSAVHVLVLVGGTLAFNLRDLKDVRGDQAAGIRTLANLFPHPWGGVVCGGLGLFVSVWVPWYIGYSLVDIVAAGALGGVPLLWLATRRPFREWPLFIVYALWACWLLFRK